MQTTTVMDKIQSDKLKLRKRLLNILLSLTQEEIIRRSKNVKKLLSESPIYKKASIVMAYFPIKGEVDLLELFRKDLGVKRFCFPVIDITTKRIRPFEVKDIDGDFVSGPYGIKQPDLTRLKEIDINKIDLVIVPGIAFDYQRHRLGRGAGYYDRFLSNIKPPAAKAGVAFNTQILKDLPIHSTHDQIMDLVVSEDRVI